MSPGCAERTAHVTKTQDAIERKRLADISAIDESRSAVNAAAKAASDQVAADALETELKLSIALANTCRRELKPALVKYRAQPTRKLALQIAKSIRALRVDADEQLGSDICPVLIASIFASVLIDEMPQLLPVFAMVENYAGPPISAATRLLQASESDFVLAFEVAVSDLEKAIEHVAATAPRSPENSQHRDCYEALTLHATAAHRATVVAALREKFGREAAAASTYVPPVSVSTEGGVDAAGRQWSRSVVSYDAPVTVATEDEGHSVVERGPGAQAAIASENSVEHFERLNAS